MKSKIGVIIIYFFCLFVIKEIAGLEYLGDATLANTTSNATTRIDQDKKCCQWNITHLPLYSKHCQRKCSRLNVCNKTVSYNVYFQQRVSYIKYYRTCCGRFLGIFWCTDDCSRSYSVYYTKSQISVTTRRVFECCPGWLAKENECTIPICRPGCVYGRCTEPNHCECHDGYTGDLCKTDVNECETSKPCSQVCSNIQGTYACSCNKGYIKADANNLRDGNCLDIDECTTLKPCRCATNLGVCTAYCKNTNGSFSCSCKAGFHLAFDQKTCVDTNECKVVSLNKCQQKCFNTIGSYQCSCNSGFKLSHDKFSCIDINECSHLNGGCNHICNNKQGSFSCSCHRGFQLQSNKRTCQDINECKEKKSVCDASHGICRNLPGSFSCGCKIGFVLLGDRKSCIDINECSKKSTNGCTQKCANTVGSYMCSCNPGFKLNANQRSCDDLNECTLNTHKCQHSCHNTVGSYICSCKTGYTLESDGGKCIGNLCESLKKPLNGNIYCSGSRTGSVCSFTCNDGFWLHGSVERRCQPISTWSGEAAICREKSCPDLLPPLHGTLILPCLQKFRSTCMITCQHGYYMEGASNTSCVFQGDKMQWLPNNFSCKAYEPTRKLCETRDEITSKNSCSCYDNTILCKRIEVIMPNFPQLIVNEKSKDLKVKAFSKTTLWVRINYNKRYLQLDQETLIIHSTVKEANFIVRSLKVGLFTLSFDFFGVNANLIDQPKTALIYSYRKENLGIMDTDALFSKDNRVVWEIKGQCSGILKLRSSCPFFINNNGFVSIGNNKVSLPVSLVGLSQNSLSSLNLHSFLVPSDQTWLSLAKEGHYRPGCNVTEHENSTQFKYSMISFIKYNIFQLRYINEINSLLPTWLQIEVGWNQQYFEIENLYSMLGKSMHLNEIAICQSMPIQSNSYYSFYIPKSTLALRVFSVKKDLSPETSICFGVDLCNSTVGMSFDKSSFFDFAGEIILSRKVELKLIVKGFRFGGNEKKCRGNECFNFNSSFNISSALFFKKTSSFYQFEGIVHAHFNEQFPMERFTEERIFIAYGRIVYNITLKLLGRETLLHGKSHNSTVYVKIGGNKDMSTSNGLPQKGISIDLQSSLMIQNVESTEIRFKPVSNLKLHTYFNVNGGNVLALKKSNLKLVLTRLNLIERTISMQLKRIVTYLKSTKWFGESQVISKTGYTFSNLVKRIIFSIQTIQENRTNPIVNQLDRLKQAAFTLRTHMIVVNEKVTANSILFSSRIIIAQLENLQKIYLFPITNNLSEYFNGQVISYNGAFCYQKFCFTNCKTTVYDVTINDTNDSFSKYGVKDSVIVSLKPNADLYLSPRIRIKQDQEILFHINRIRNKIRVNFPVDIQFERGFSKANLSISEREVFIEIPKLQLFNYVQFKVNAKAHVIGTTWESLLYKIQGMSSEMAESINQNAQYLYQNISLATENRLRGIINQKDLIKQRLDVQKKNFVEIQKAVEESEKALLAETGVYRKFKVQQDSSQISFDSYLKNLDPLFIQQNIEKVCTFQTCRDICLPLPVCDIKQDPLNISYTTLKCNQMNQIVLQQVQKQLHTNCSVKREIYKSVYTGTCSLSGKEDRNLNAVRAGFVTWGTFLGGPIGGIIGGILSLFASPCSRTWTVHKKIWFEDEPCTLLISALTKITRPISKCRKEDAKITAGYKMAYKECKITDCFVKIPDDSCLIANKNCNAKRKIFLENTDSMPVKFISLFNNISKFNESLTIAAAKIENLRQQTSSKKHEFKTVQNKIRLLSEQYRLLDQKHRDFVNIYYKEICILKKFKKNNQLRKTLEVNSVYFEASLPMPDNLLLNVNVTYENSDLIVPFVYNIKNFDFPQKIILRALAEKVIKYSLCRPRRKRRYVTFSDTSNPKDLTFTPWIIGQNKKLSFVELSCITMQTVLQFFKDISGRLYADTFAASKLRNQVIYVSNRLNNWTQNSNISESTNGYGYNRLTNHSLNQANSNLQILDLETTSQQVVATWKQQADIITGYRNFTQCLYLDDCINNAIKTLFELPPILSITYQSFESLLFEMREHFSSLGKQKTLSELLIKYEKIKAILNKLNSTSLHCTQPPKVFLKDHLDENIEDGYSVVIKCLVKSKIPYKYFWKQDQKLLDGQNSELLTIKVSTNTEGVYTCLAKSLVGEGESNGKFIRVYQKPFFIEQPKNVTYIIPSESNDHIFLVCNASGSPKPQTQWIFTSFEGNKYIKTENETFLEIDGENFTNAGFYQCFASNSFGQEKSHISKVDILKAVPTNIYSNISIEISNATNRKVIIKYLQTLVEKTEKELSKFVVDVNLESEIKNNTMIASINFFTTYTSNMNRSFEEMLSLASELRKSFAASVAVILKTFVQDNFKIATSNDTFATIIKKNILLDMKTNICNPGHQLHPNGFMCITCPKGAAGSGCKLCPLHAYMDKLGGTRCIPCPNRTLTTTKGSTSKMDCINSLKRRSDVIFVVDITKSFLRAENALPTLIGFIGDFIHKFKGAEHARFGLIAYGASVEILIELDNYKSKSHLMGFLSLLDIVSEKKQTHLALKQAQNIFAQQSDRASKKILMIFTNGNYEKIFNRFQDQFFETRKIALSMQRDEIHIVCFGVGLKLEIDEMRAMASYPSQENVIFLWDKEKALNQTLKVVNGFLKDKCVYPSIDIGILMETRGNNKSHNLQNQKTITELISNVFDPLPNASYLLIPPHTCSPFHYFLTYNKTRVSEEFSKYYKKHNKEFDILERIKEAEYIDLTERHVSRASYNNSLMIFSDNPIPENDLKVFKKNSYGEHVIIANFVINDVLIERTESIISTKMRKDRINLGFDEFNLFVKRIERRAVKKRPCQG